MSDDKKSAVDQIVDQALTEQKDKKSSDNLAETLEALQNVIENNAKMLVELNKNMKEHRDMLKNIFDNDSELQELEKQAKESTTKLKEKKARLNQETEVVNKKLEINELREQKKEIEETLSSHLLNYFQLTNSKSFDTSNGDQWDFDIKAKVKTKNMLQ